MVTQRNSSKILPIKEKILAFGWECVEANGHDQEDLIKKFNNRDGNKPFMIIGNTIKGKGVSFMKISLFGIIDLQAKRNIK